MRLTLEKKIALLSILPLAAFVFAAFLLCMESWRQFQAAKSISHNSRLFEATALFVHEMQKERGISALFLSDKATVERLAEQRKITDASATDFMGQLKQADDLEAASLKSSDKALGEWSEARKLVDAKAPSSEAVLKYTSLIGSLIEFESKAALAQKLDGLEAMMISVVGIEMAKENAGRLRATVAGALSADGPIQAHAEERIQQFKNGVESSLGSPLLQLSDDGKNSIQAFMNDETWKEVVRTSRVVIDRRDSGKFGLDPDQFFQTATKSIDSLYAILTGELKHLRATLDEVERRARNEVLMLGCLVVIGSLGLLTVLMRTGRSVSRSLGRLADGLARSAESLAAASVQIATSSTQLEAGGTEQAAAVQQTVSAVTEVSATVSKNAENARSGQEYSDVGRQVALEGEQAVREMIDSISEIDASNAEIMKKIEEGNREIAGIAKLITEIAEKTNVINDIVFQTKLLSFNASVEAARAGEHGKGFAVVAQEIGSLAQMSGNAAHEIGRMLEDSTRKVEVIIESTRERVEALAKTGREKVEVGVQRANRCGDAIKEVRLSVERMNEIISQIAHASSEQSTAIREISMAMNQLDSVVHKNNSVAHESAEVAVQLKGETGSMQDIASELILIVRGEEVRGVA